MKLFKTDISAKWINFSLNGEEYSIHFKDNLVKGVHEVSVWKGKGKSALGITDAQIKSAYPPLKKLLGEIALLMKLEFRRFFRRHNQ